MPRWPTSSSWRHGCFWHPTECTGAAHYLTDALGGVVLALSWLLVTYRVVRPDYW
jgi:hypothetical protein